MTSLFADQFGYRTPYGLGPLATGVPSIGIRLPEGKSTPASEGANVGANAAAGATAGAAAEAANGLTTGQDQSNTVGTAGQQQAARQGTLKKLMYLNRDDTGASNSATYAPGSFNINLTNPATGANANVPSPEWGMHPNTKTNPEVYINRTPTSPTSMPTNVHPVHVAGGTEWMPNTPAPQPTNQAPAIFGGGHVGSPGLWDVVKGAGGQLVHDIATSGHNMANIFQNQNSFGDKNFQVPNTPGGYSTSTGSAGAIAQHGQPWSSYTNVPGSDNGIASPNYNVGINEGPGNYGGYGQVAANDVGNDASHINWAQFFRTAVGDMGEEG